MVSTTGLSAGELAEVLEQLPSGVVVVDRAGRPQLTNHAACRLLGALADESSSLIQIALGAGIRDAHTGQPASSESTPLARALRGEVVTSEEYTLDSPDGGEPRRVRISSLPLRDAHGPIVGAISVFTDITAELAQAKRVAQLLEVEQSSQHRLRLALEASHMGTWDYDVARDHIEWSAEMASIVGAPVEELSGSLFHGFNYVHPDDRPRVERAVREALARGRSLQVETRIQYGADQRVRWLLAKGRVYRDAQGRPVSMTGIAMDITERKEAEAARHAMAHGERLRALGEMASGVAHDLNQSLALITGYSEIAHQELDHEVPDVGRLREMVEITARAALEGGEALRALLSFVSDQDVAPEAEHVDVAELLQDVARLTAPRWRDAAQAEGRPIQLKVTAEPRSAINGSPAAMREAITNLIFNAVDALPQGGTIDLVAYRQAGEVVVEVRDTGTGIPRELQARVFDPFFTTKGTRGTGLGLLQVLTIVKRHGGTIALESTPDQGTTFRLKFPRATVATTNQSETTQKQVTAPKRSIRILVVEDEQQLARMAGLVLSQPGHTVVVEPSGEAGLERLECERFDLIISDLGLGSGKNGWDLAEEVRRRWPGTRFVLVTGWGAAIDPKEARARGVHEVIPKPYRIADLRQVADNVAEHLDSE